MSAGSIRGSPSGNGRTLDESDQEKDDGCYEEDMDKPSDSIETDYSEEPEHEEYYGDSEKHSSVIRMDVDILINDLTYTMTRYKSLCYRDIKRTASFTQPPLPQFSNGNIRPLETS